MVPGTFYCISCGRQNPLHGANYANKYCNNKCQSEHRRKLLNEERVNNWLNGCGLYVWKEVPSYITEYLLRERGHRCETCGTSEWQNKPAPLLVAQRDRNHYNNKSDNLEIICPNCRAVV